MGVKQSKYDVICQYTPSFVPFELCRIIDEYSNPRLSEVFMDRIIALKTKHINNLLIDIRMDYFIGKYNLMIEGSFSSFIIELENYLDEIHFSISPIIIITLDEGVYEVLVSDDVQDRLERIKDKYHLYLGFYGHYYAINYTILPNFGWSCIKLWF